MLDGECHNTKTVWGFPVPIRDNGRKIWSDELRAMAVRKIEAGAGIRETAEEIGANKSLVAHWVKCAQAHANGDAPAFVEVLQPSTAETLRHKTTTATPTSSDTVICKISIGDADIAIPPGFPPEHLAEILRAVRSSQ